MRGSTRTPSLICPTLSLLLSGTLTVDAGEVKKQDGAPVTTGESPKDPEEGVAEWGESPLAEIHARRAEREEESSGGPKRIPPCGPPGTGGNPTGGRGGSERTVSATVSRVSGTS